MAAAVAAAVPLFWNGAAAVGSARVGAAAAWAASATSVVWLLWARERPGAAFWWAFGGGMALRAAVLAGLCAWGLTRAGGSMAGLLLAYVLTLSATLLTLELRYLRIR